MHKKTKTKALVAFAITVIAMQLVFISGPAMQFAGAEETTEVPIDESVVTDPVVEPIVEPIVEVAPESTPEPVVTEEVATEPVVEETVPIEEVLSAETSESVETNEPTLTIQPELTTDKPDYQPGETVSIFGRFFRALENIVLKIFGGSAEEENYTESTQNVTTDEQGFFNASYIIDIVYRPLYNIVANLLLGDGTTGDQLARTTFTDSPVDQTPLEIDGNAIDNGPPPIGTDWNVVIGATCDANETGGGVIKATCVTDQLTGDLGFTGGGSKDDSNISSWAWSAASGEQTPSKDNIRHTFGAVFTDGSGHQILYFGLDREKQNGDAQVGFWLLKNKISPGAGGQFVDQNNAVANHTDGDLLVQSNFTKGGNISNLSIYKWQSGSLILIESTTPGVSTGCNTVASGFPAGAVCVGVNSASANLSWVGTVEAGIFFEGGIDLTDIGFAANSCLSEFVAETRASTPFDAVLKDFALGNLSTCGTITITKDTVPNNAQDFSFTTIGNGLSPFSLDDDGETIILSNTKTFSNLLPGSYSVTEGLQAGYNLTNLVCVDPTSNTTVDLPNRTANINVGTSETVSCTFTNEPSTGHIIVVKDAVPNDAQNFTFTNNFGNGNPASFDLDDDADGTLSNTRDSVVTAGTYSVSEGAVAGWTQTSANCSDGSPISAVVVSPGETVTCTFTNTKDATLTLVKTVINNNGGTAVANDFQAKIDGNNVPWGVAQVVSVGTHTASETTLAGYTASVWGTDCAADGSVTLAAGDNKSCTITNNDIQPKLTVTKVVVNDNGGTKVIADFPLFVDQTSVTSGVQNGFNVGAYIVSETGDSGYAATITGDCDAQGNVSLALADVKSCTITNNDIPATLKIIKDAVPNDCKDFSFTTNWNGGFTLDDDGGVVDCLDTNQPQSKEFTNLSVGSYTVTETVPNFWQLGSITCVNKDTGLPFPVTVNGNGMTVNLGLAENVECTFTNNKLGPSRTQGFWKNHTSFTTSIFQNPLELSPGFTANRIVIGTEAVGSHYVVIDSQAKLFGAYLANVAKKSDNKKRTNIEQARIQLLHQLLTAKINCGAFGCTPAIRAMIVSADAAYSGTDTNAMNNWAGQLDAFNNSGDTIIVSPPLPLPGKATPKDSQSIADIPFWNLP